MYGIVYTAIHQLRVDEVPKGYSIIVSKHFLFVVNYLLDPFSIPIWIALLVPTKHEVAPQLRFYLPANFYATTFNIFRDNLAKMQKQLLLNCESYLQSSTT